MFNNFKLAFLFIVFIMLAGLAYSNCLPVKAMVVDDLELTGISVSPAPSFNYEVTIRVGVKNNGENQLTSLDGFSSYNYTFDNFEVSSIDMPPLPINVGAVAYYEIKGKFNKIDSSRLYFMVNSENVLAERTQVNNYKSININVVSSRDLSAGSLVINPIYPAEDQECVITVTVRNGGKFDLTSNYGINSYLYQFSDFKETDKTIPDVTLADKLEVGSSVEFIFIGSFTSAGEKNLLFKVDKDDFIEESNEDNNEATKTITIGAADAVDIFVNSIKFNKNKDELIKDDIITVTASIINLSDYGLVSDTGFLERNYGWSTGGDYELTIPGIEITNVAHTNYPTDEAPLNPDGRFTYTFTGTVKDTGAGTANFKIDIHNELVETDEANNSISETYTVYDSLETLYNYSITDVKIKFYNTDHARLSWRTSEKATDGYVMYKNQGYGAYDRFLLDLELDSWPESLSKTEHSVDLPGLAPGIEYLYSIKTENDHVNKEYGVKNFTAPLDNSVSFITGPAAVVAGENVEIKWEASLITIGTLYYKLAGASAYIEKTSPLNDTHALNLEGLTPGSYEYYISASTTAGTKAQSPAQGFTIQETATEEATETETVAEEETTETPEVPAPPSVSVSEDGEEINTTITNQSLYSRLKGKIMLKVEDLGKAYYINPAALTRHYLGRPVDAFNVMREQGIGIANANLEKIPIGLIKEAKLPIGSLASDLDKDGLSDIFEDAIGTDKNKADTDGDGFSDKNELENGYNPAGGGDFIADNKFTAAQHGKIFLQVEGNGEAWYINPADGKRYFLGRPADAFSVMRTLGLGISNNDFDVL